ncbi:hypothetical protein [Pedobacter frigiditerrae]|uniref:hypothetical protein n=1 Tax=Pedobacter frigiditerrae TaxID=2530452 RepID=UPI0029310382|nr:hypothetical protein [Pedobacter frigiditerrae]
MKLIKICMVFIALATSCDAKPKQAISPKTQVKNVSNFDTSTKTIHVFVALCDNKYQGIVPVPKAIGNGQDPDNNLYWGYQFTNNTEHTFQINLWFTEKCLEGELRINTELDYAYHIEEKIISF